MAGGDAKVRKFLDENIRHRRSVGMPIPQPGRLRLTNVTPGAVYHNIEEFCQDTADTSVESKDAEIEVCGGYLPVNLLFGLLGLRLYAAEHRTA